MARANWGLLSRCSRLWQSSPEKRHDVVLRALARVPRSGQDVYLIVAGEGQLDESWVEDMISLVASGLQLAERVVDYVGFVEDSADVLAASDVLVLVQDNEAVGLIVLEAMAAGVTIVSATLELLRECRHR